MLNPFVELFRNPVVTLAAIGYAMLLVALLIVTLGVCYRNAVEVHARWDRERPRQWEYVPPLGFILRAAAIPTILWIDAWAIAALVWLIS